MLKKWRVSFNPETEYFTFQHFWILLLGLPLHMWNEGALKDIGDALGSFISVDRGLLTSPVRKVCRILVEMDISRGLPETLEIEWRGRCLLQRLDYLGIPFRCSLCRSTGHLRRDCKGLFEEQEEQEDHLSTIDYIDLSIETGFYSAGPGVCSPDLEEPEQATQHFLVSSKIIVLFFFYSLVFGKRNLKLLEVVSSVYFTFLSFA
jgi:hypothetical protein